MKSALNRAKSEFATALQLRPNRDAEGCDVARSGM